MFLQTLQPPVAGEPFRFSVAGANGETSIEVRIDGRCIHHETRDQLLSSTLVDIPLDAAGRVLTIRAIDSVGHDQSLEYEISAADPGPHSMLWSTRAS